MVTLDENGDENGDEDEDDEEDEDGDDKRGVAYWVPWVVCHSQSC